MKIFMKRKKLFGLSCFTRNSERLLTLLLVLVGVGKAVFPVHGKSINHPSKALDFSAVFNTQNITKPKKESAGITTEIRFEKLHNMCTSRFVRVLRKGNRGVNARGKKKGKLSGLNLLVFENTEQRTIKIWGAKTGWYICFSKRGKLITRKNGNKKLCQFIEREDGDYFKYQTADENHSWYMGFRKTGRPLKGSSRRHPECFKFLKVGQKYKCDKKGKHGIKHCVIAALKTGTGSFRPQRRSPSTPRHRHYIPKELTG